MPKLIFAIFILGFWSLVITPAKATDTQINNTVHSFANGSGATSNVSITNDVGGSSNSSGSSNCTTNIVIDSNGEHKEYHGDCGNIDLKSGNNSVTISNHASSTPGKTQTPNVLSVQTAQPSSSLSPNPATPSASPTPNRNHEFNLLEFIKQELKNIINILSHF